MFAGESKIYMSTQRRKDSKMLSVWNFWCHKNHPSGHEATVTQWKYRGSYAVTAFGGLANWPWTQQQSVVEPCPHSEFDLRVVGLFLLRAAGVCPWSGMFCLHREVHLSVIEPSFLFAAVRVPTVDFVFECWGSAHIGVVVPGFFFFLRKRRVSETEREALSDVFFSIQKSKIMRKIWH